MINIQANRTSIYTAPSQQKHCNTRPIFMLSEWRIIALLRDGCQFCPLRNKLYQAGSLLFTNIQHEPICIPLR